MAFISGPQQPQLSAIQRTLKAASLSPSAPAKGRRPGHKIEFFSVFAAAASPDGCRHASR
jgi:hypothetical protein